MAFSLEFASGIGPGSRTKAQLKKADRRSSVPLLYPPRMAHCYGAPCCRGGSAVCCGGKRQRGPRTPTTALLGANATTRIRQATSSAALTPAVGRIGSDTDVLRCHCCIRRAWRLLWRSRAAARISSVLRRGKAAARSAALDHRTAWSQREDADPPGDVVCELTPAVARSSIRATIRTSHTQPAFTSSVNSSRP